MAYLVRLATGLLLALCGAMIWTPAHASFAATPPATEEFRLSSATAWFTTRQGAADAFIQYREASNTSGSENYSINSITTTGGSGWGSLFYKITNASTGAVMVANQEAWFSRQVPTAYSCPANSTLSGTTCTCNASYTQVGSSCVLQQQLDNQNCKNLVDGLNLIGAPMLHYGSVGLTACFGGYVIAGSGGAGGGGQSELYGPFRCSGVDASACQVTPKPQDITANCALGAYPGTVNGVQVCIPPTNTVEAPKETTALPPTPGASAPQVPGAPAGTTTVTETTKCDKGVCETTKDFKDSTGTSLGKVTDTKSQAARCAESPKAPGCEALEASSFGGSCDGGFTYKGDAIQGAIAKEIYKQNCLMNATSEESDLYNAEKIKTGNRTLDLPGNEVVNVSSSNFDQSNALGVGPACIGDKAIVVMGSSISLPFSNICPWLENLGMVLMALSALLSARIVTRG